MEFTYRPRGVCSQLMEIEIEGDKLKHLKVTGGCSGNLQGIARLVEGMEVKEVISRLEGIRCGFKPTSCPDQLARALKQCLEAEE
ncbi:MAG: TIGR03905 family TSCPD domain-containing protein [Candidatus Limivicinus sp.]